MAKNIGKIEITYELLHALLELPDGVQVVYVCPSNPDDIFSRHAFTAVLQGTGLPLTPEGAPIPVVKAKYRTGGSALKPRAVFESFD